jgi:hypothetical protein
MFTTDQPAIQRHAEASPQGIVDVITFVLATINRYFYYVPDVLDEHAHAGLDDCKYWKPIDRRGIAYVIAKADYYHSRLPVWREDSLTCLRELVEIPGIGIVKAGFICQLLTGKVGCLDRHNLRTMGLNEKTFARVPANTEALTERLRVYMAACEALGTSAQMWDGWVNLVAAKYPNHFASGEEVSRLHVTLCKAE